MSRKTDPFRPTWKLAYPKSVIRALLHEPLGVAQSHRLHLPQPYLAWLGLGSGLGLRVRVR